MDTLHRGEVEVRNLTRTFGSGGQEIRALDDVSFTIPAGKFVSVVGPSGCGKSSLLMMLVGLSEATSGTLEVAGAPVTGPDPDRIGVVFQEANLFPWLTAGKNVEFPLMLKGVGKAERADKANAALDLVGLQGFAARYPHELSGGMKQRVSIARGIVQDPDVLMMDEPFAALDEQTRMVMGDELLNIWERTKKTVMFVTHSLTEAIYLSDHVIVMSARPGRIVDRIDVDLPRPRTFEMTSTPEFTRLRNRIWEQIRVA
ncbi:ABC transporter ATP-binding protein [Aurantimonas endophytica]|uniref:NitT/TauT family transport system ATP-binding protein n=1 Tax=Aurantimonas endophytica TaxID=1522175 RepID=A0A7W6HBM1_9HYPH|nr:ABC transporter ATP-binding protein [Aurantimonas endophytica]MBB4002168.1 NitT/TauT family transport system ATP-binding protein [Aurantimonas endophytica]MCO6402203.1 ATP-binding cassette domain-containing protein [Aurantimonas endophytica]